MNILNRVRHVLGMAPADTGNWGAAGFLAMIIPLMVIAAFSITAGSAPSLALAEEGKTVEVKEAEIKVGDRVVLRMSGECAKECHRLFEANAPFNPGKTQDLNTQITRIMPDGGCVIEVTTPLTPLVDDGKTPQLFTMTVNFQSSRLKKMPPWKDEDQYVGVVSKEGKEEIRYTGRVVLNEPNVPKTTDSGEEIMVVKLRSENGDEEIMMLAPKNSGMLLELSSLKGVKMNLWELKSQAGD